MCCIGSKLVWTTGWWWQMEMKDYFPSTTCECSQERFFKVRQSFNTSHLSHVLKYSAQVIVIYCSKNMYVCFLLLRNPNDFSEFIGLLIKWTIRVVDCLSVERRYSRMNVTSVSLKLWLTFFLWHFVKKANK